MNYRILINLIIISALLISCNNNRFDYTAKNSLPGKKIILKIEKPDSSIIQIYNNDTVESVFKMKLNNKIYYDLNEILNSIIILKSENLNEPVFMKAWRFISLNTFHLQGKFISNKNWLYSPVILINSLGIGNCGIRAAALSNIWQKFGYTSRVWLLEGHVVPEIFINNRWEMYDPDMYVYYFDNNKKILGVKELCEKPYFIYKPVNKLNIANDEYIDSARYSFTTANYYISTYNNFLFNWNVEDKDLSVKLEFKIPPKGKFEFPAKFVDKLLSTTNEEIQNHTNAKLTIPANWKGTIDIPLVIQSICGKGSVSINGKNFDLSSDEFKNYLNKKETFFYSIKFIKTQSDIEIIYLINKKIFKLEKNNIILLQGNHIEKISVKVSSLP